MNAEVAQYVEDAQAKLWEAIRLLEKAADLSDYKYERFLEGIYARIQSIDDRLGDFLSGKNEE